LGKKKEKRVSRQKKKKKKKKGKRGTRMLSLKKKSEPGPTKGEGKKGGAGRDEPWCTFFAGGKGKEEAVSRP